MFNLILFFAYKIPRRIIKIGQRLNVPEQSKQTIHLKRKRNGNEGKRKFRPVGELVCAEDRIINNSKLTTIIEQSTYNGGDSPTRIT